MFINEPSLRNSMTILFCNQVVANTLRIVNLIWFFFCSSTPQFCKTIKLSKKYMISEIHYATIFLLGKFNSVSAYLS